MGGEKTAMAAKDPVCGMTVLTKHALVEREGDKPVYFCSTYCRDRFATEPARFSSMLVAETSGEQPSQRKIARNGSRCFTAI